MGDDQHTKVTIVTHISTGETEAVLSHKVSQRFPVTELHKAEDLYERLTCGSGRKAYKPEDLAHPYNPN